MPQQKRRCGSPITIGRSLKRLSLVRSGTYRRSFGQIVVLQTVTSRGHSAKSAGKPVLRLEPLPTLFEHANKGDRTVAYLSRKLGQRIVSEFRRRIDDLIEGEGC